MPGAQAGEMFPDIFGAFDAKHNRRGEKTKGL
jgi:hypothetical protein